MYWSYYLTDGFIAIGIAVIILLLFLPVWKYVQDNLGETEAN